MFYRYKVWSNIRPTDWSLWHYGITSHTKQFLPKVHILVPDLDGDWHCMPLDLSSFVCTILFWGFLSHGIASYEAILNFRSLLQGRTSHKFVDLSENAVMRLYYTNKQVLFFMCATNELFFSSLYLLHFTSGPLGVFRLICYVTAPFMFIKTLISLLQAYVACQNISIVDVKEREALKKAK